MIKCFLSHSSKDKDSFVRQVANGLKKEHRIYDEYSFEEGADSLKEIIRYLKKTDLFVIFISDHSLNSDFVKFELNIALAELEEGILNRIFPIIIDNNINYQDERIPQKLKNLNIKPILNPKLIVRKIYSQMTEISWELHPKLKEFQDVFVGRNDVIQEMEERLNDFQKDTPSALIASGLPTIGRKSFLKHIAKKASLIKDSYHFIHFHMSELESIEDFTMKVADSGIYSLQDDEKEKIESGTKQEKLEITIKIIENIIHSKERILIEDKGALVQLDGQITNWFNEIIQHIKHSDHVTFFIASKYRFHNRWSNESIFSVSIKELNYLERTGLLTRYNNINKISLEREDIHAFSEIFTGLPEQVAFAAEMIKEDLYAAKQKRHLIQSFASDKAKVIIESIKDEDDSLELIYLISKFEFISYETLFKIVPASKYENIIFNLLNQSVVEKVGATGEYLRLNDVIKDYIQRNKFPLTEETQKALNNFLINFATELQQSNGQEADLSEYFFGLEQLIFQDPKKTGLNKFIPSTFLKAIKKHYINGDYREAIDLANIILERESSNYSTINQQIRFIKCQSLAKRKLRKEFNIELSKIPNEDRFIKDRIFLKGFYSRLDNEYLEAKQQYETLLKTSQDPKVISEMVIVCLALDDFDAAFIYAQKIYLINPQNPIHANSYFTCLIQKEKNSQNKEELNKIIQGLSIDVSTKAVEIIASMRARMAAYYENNYEESFKIINNAIDDFPEIIYPLLTKADISIYFKDINKFEEAINSIENLKNGKSNRTYTKYKAVLHKIKSENGAAEALLNKPKMDSLRSSVNRIYKSFIGVASENGK